jgi:hypothetical protein
MNTEEVENKIKSQIEHMLTVHVGYELKYKMYDLAFEWYMKGLITGLEHGKEWKDK